MLNTIFKVPNNEEGNEFLKLAKKFLNKEDYRLVKRGRNPNRADFAEKDGLHRGAYRDSLPLKYASTIAVYIHPKKEVRVFPDIASQTLVGEVDE